MGLTSDPIILFALMLAGTMIAVYLALCVVWAILRLCNMMLRGEPSRSVALNILSAMAVIPTALMVLVAAIWIPTLLTTALIDLLAAFALCAILRTCIPILLKNIDKDDGPKQ